MESSQSDLEICDENGNPLAGWTDDDKFDLCEALEVFGSANMVQIRKNVKTKSPEQIRVAIDYYNKKALDRKRQNSEKVVTEIDEYERDSAYGDEEEKGHVTDSACKQYNDTLTESDKIPDENKADEAGELENPAANDKEDGDSVLRSEAECKHMEEFTNDHKDAAEERDLTGPSVENLPEEREQKSFEGLIEEKQGESLKDEKQKLGKVGDLAGLIDEKQQEGKQMTGLNDGTKQKLEEAGDFTGLNDGIQAEEGKQENFPAKQQKAVEIKEEDGLAEEPNNPTANKKNDEAVGEIKNENTEDDDIPASTGKIIGGARKKEPPVEKKKGKKKSKRNPHKTLDGWKKFITDSVESQDLVTEPTSALRIIADLESFPHNLETYDVDFRKVYHQIADAMEGKRMPDDPMATAILRKCLQETTDLCKELKKNSSYGAVTTSISQTDTESFSQTSQDSEFNTFSYISSESNYNPLHIDEQYLQWRLNPDEDKG